ncbi:MAG: alpha/beta fold hydrolase [Acidimicrobiia bacterium]
MTFEKVELTNAAGERLGARLDLPIDGDPIAYALFAHCFTCTKNLRAVGSITGALAALGVATLRFDFTGLGESEGDFADTNFSSNVDDLVAAAGWLEEHHEAPSLLIGHSLGGAAVLKAAALISGVRAVATIGAPSSPEHVLRHLAGAVEDIADSGEAEVLLAGRPFTIRKQFLDDIAASSLETSIASLGVPLLVLHSPVDTTVGVEEAAAIFGAARHPKSFVSLDHADHLLHDEADSRYAGTVIAAWASRYLESSLADRAAAPSSDDPPRSTTVVRTGSGYRTDIISNGFPLTADEPLSVGGTNLGPTPYDLLLSSLGACTSMTLRMYADRRGWPLAAVTVTLSHRKLHARDCEECEGEEGYVDHIERFVALDGSLDDSQRARLRLIADKCPVHKTLHGTVVVHTDLV